MKLDEVRCFKDDAVMVRDDAGYYRCTLCGLIAEPVYYDYEKVKADFEGKLRVTPADYEVDPNDGAEHPWGHLAPKRKPKRLRPAFEPEEPKPGPVTRYKLDISS